MLAFLALACKRGDESVDRDQLLAKLVTAVCTSVKSCCDVASLELDNQKCHDDVVNHLQATIQDPLLAYDPNQGGACVDAVQASAESCQEIDYSPCLAAFSASRPPGASCSQALDCAKGPYGLAVCTRDGVCVQPTRGQPNQPCGYSCIDSAQGMDCESIYLQSDAYSQVACHSWDGLACSVSAGGTCQPIAGDCRLVPQVGCPNGGKCDTSTGACIGPIPLGGPCTASADCGDTAYCGSGTCQPLKPLHGLCADSSECDTHRCVDGICSPFSKLAANFCYDLSPKH